MIQLGDLLEFSRTHCIAICALLVPLNLIMTLLTLACVYFSRPVKQLQMLAMAAMLPALAMVLHVLTWLVIGVVMPPTYILLSLGTTCWVINFLAIRQPLILERALGIIHLAFPGERP
ncbi:hypothetical protein BST81_22015 [Leptolyngbya sp. 'hensonii']|uniref:hypothetical protein n=1 Tax=Leptolyngbya sp. 'hensonii' TaxID=1922337 RepID=UPI00094F6EC6|nr:hypothetical protein [Leptolyngbya sp. 'hensonii']OLP16279.1 hypothetical protein BST81_22015 [Leptolyngbya sp. 'hensonii']